MSDVELEYNIRHAERQVSGLLRIDMSMLEIYVSALEDAREKVVECLSIERTLEYCSNTYAQNCIFLMGGG